jgi:integrase
LTSGSLRVRVYAGKDIVTDKDRYLSAVVPAGPNAETLIGLARERLLAEIAENRHPKTDIALNVLIEEHLNAVDLEDTTRDAHLSNLRKHIEPRIGRSKASVVGVKDLESFIAELRRCRDHCSGRPTIIHRTTDAHRCTRQCRKHVCKPLAKSTVRKIMFLISAAYESGIRWEWLTVNPVLLARVPGAVAPNPKPPSPEDAATIVNAAWQYADYLGPLVWLGMTVGLRRGEACALRWRNLQSIILTPVRSTTVSRRGASL